MKKLIVLLVILFTIGIVYIHDSSAIGNDFWILKYPHLQPALSTWKIPLIALDTLIISGIDTTTVSRKLITITQSNTAYSAKTGATSIGTLASLTFTLHVPATGDSVLGKLWLRSTDSSFVIGTGTGLSVLAHL